MTLSISKLTRHFVSFAAVALLIAAVGGRWSRASAAPTTVAQTLARPASATSPAGAAVTRPGDPGDEAPAKKGASRKQITGKLNLNTATEEQLMLLPTVGPAKAERVVTWRKKNGGFKRIADLRRVKGFGYKTFKKLEPFLDIKGDTTLAAR